MLKQVSILLLSLFFVSLSAQGQITFPVNGIPYQQDQPYVLINATIHIDHQTTIDSATLIVRKGRIEDVGKGLKIPTGSIIQDMKGLHIYPSFIDPYSNYGMPALEKDKQEGRRGPHMNSNTPGAYSWNQALKPETEGHKLFAVSMERAEALRGAGFGMVLSLPQDGISRGTGCVVLLGSGNENDMLVKEKAATAFSFKKGSSRQDYPTSEMGSIALLRQSFLDAQWYAAGGSKEERNISIQSWVDNKSLPMFFEADNYLQSLRIDKVGDEFGVNYIIKGSGDEYKRLEAIRQTGNTYILPLSFPENFNMTDPYDSRYVTLEDLMHWEQAPYNAISLEKVGVKIALTGFGLKDPSSFIQRIRQLHSLGMKKESILKASISTPAELLSVNNVCGAIKKGYMANFIVSDNDLFADKTLILQNWINGIPYLLTPKVDDAVKGMYSLSIGNDRGMSLTISGDETSLNGSVSIGQDTTKANVSYKAGIIKLSFEFQKGPNKGSYHLTGYRNQKGFEGKSSESKSWLAVYEGDTNEGMPNDTGVTSVDNPGKIRFPAMAYGFSELPKSQKTLIRNATVWTNEKEGVLENTDVLLDKGKIVAIGKSLPAADANVIDGTGLHLTAGIIDEHSHIAVSQSVNECSHAITSEVRIGDVIDPDDINIYRQLSGGVTTSQLLHGSCNPIGGQSAIIKLRWGRSAEEMKFENAPGFIKFALGENVKQSNWGDDFRSRYPQSRMGVEQVYVDAFTRAIEYENRRKAAASKKSPSLFRRDLRLETLAEIMNNKRHITCHSYQQGEITMLMRVADSLGFKVNTFTHILEGYKIADKMKEHGVGASSFSDWWAYKYEVIEAIPHNGAILHDVGVTVAFNSDDAEMARRLNQEAAKAIRYGGLSEEEALKFVTLNPAKLLRIDDRVGSIKVGKDADLVLWSENPLSIYAKAQKTFIDGVCYYDSVRDVQMRNEVEKERLRIMTKMQNSNKKGGSEARNPSFKLQKLFHCMDEEEEHH